MTNAYVHVTGTPSESEDDEVPGTYLVAIAANAPKDLLVEIALESFHVKVAIGTLDDFEIEVLDAGGRNFAGQNEGPDLRDKHPLLSWGSFEGRVDANDLPFALPSPPILA